MDMPKRTLPAPPSDSRRAWCTKCHRFAVSPATHTCLVCGAAKDRRIIQYVELDIAP